MLLQGFRVRMFRSIVDSGPVPVFALTALVGRAESGKTSLLQALEALHPDSEIRPSPERDWPREQRRVRPHDEPFCSALFELSERPGARLAELAGLERRLERIQLARTYGGDYRLAPAPSRGLGALDPRALERPRDEGALLEFLRESLPAFVFVGRQSIIRGIERDGQGPDGAERTRAALLRLAGLELESLAGRDAAELVRAGENRLRQALAELGRTSPLRLRLAAEGLAVLVETEEGELVALENAPQEQAFGLTVDLLLSASGGASRERGAVLLLDGPGRFLRNGGAARLRELLRGYRRPCQAVLYTARLPFRMDLQHAEQVLVLAPTQRGSVVSRVEPEQDLNLRAALGMTGRSSFLVADLNLVVEGPGDAELVGALADLLRRSGEPSLPAHLNVVPAGGSHEVASVAAFLDHRGLGAVALFDSDGAGRAARGALGRKVPEGRVAALLLSDAAELGRPEAAIEELFPLDWYLEAVREVCRERCPQALEWDLTAPAGVKVAQHLDRVFRVHGAVFPKTAVVGALRERLEGLESLSELPPGVQRAARALISSLLAALRAAHGPGRMGEPAGQGPLSARLDP